MDFKEKLAILLKEEENEQFKEAKPADIDKVNTNPESRVNPEEILDLSLAQKDLRKFIELVNPLRGEIKRNALFKYVREFRRRGKDVLILKGEKGSDLLPFYSVDRGQLTSFLATLMDDEEAFKRFKDQLETIYTTEETELMPEDYIDFVINNKISIMSNPGMEFDIEGASKETPTNLTPKNQEDLSVDPQKIEDSEGFNKGQKKDK